MYKSEKISQNTYRILDTFDEALYLIIRDNRAYLIDTGMDPDPLQREISNLTSLPIQVLLTHGHIDHIGRTGEFAHVAMSPLDSDIYRAHKKLAEGDNFFIRDRLPDALKPCEDGIFAIPLPGHTPGSTLFADPVSRTVYTGDAVGSGCGVWMQIEGALSISAYRDGLASALEALKKVGCDDTWRFFGGHARQEYQSRVSSYNPLSLGLIRDMHTLCTLLLEGKVPLEKADVRSDGVPYYAHYNRAEMLTTKERIR